MEETAAGVTWPWEEDDATPSDGPRRRAALVAVALVPWVLVVALVFRGQPSPGSPTMVDTPTTPPVAGAPSPAPAVAASDREDDPPSPLAETAGVLVTSAARHTADLGDAVTVAVLVARGWFHGTGPALSPATTPDTSPEGGARTGYVEHVWVEAIDAPWRGHVVVTLGLLVLERAGSTEALVARAYRVAVPVALDAAGARRAGEPYPLPEPVVQHDPLDLVPDDDPDRAVAAAEALQAAGFDGAEVVALRRATDSWPWVATVRTPGAPDAPTEVWLRPHLGGFVVAGWLPTRTDPDDAVTDGPNPEPSPDDEPEEEVAP